MLTGRKYRLDLTPEQIAYAERIGDICRFVWNTALEQRRLYRQRGSWMNYVPQARELAEAKQVFPWLADAPANCLQQTLMDLDKACRTHGTFNVNWRDKHRWSPAFRFPEGKKIRVERLNRRWGRVKLSKVGWVRFRWTRPLDGEIRSATVSYKSGQWYISFLVEDSMTTPERHAGTPVGVDRGIKVCATTSTGEFHDREYITVGEAKRYRRLEQQLARCGKGSANRAKVRAAKQKIMARVRDRRTDFCARTASDLAMRHSVVVLEALNTQGMTASGKGTPEAPGKKVAQKAGLNKAILAKGWHRLEIALRNAARYTGTALVLVDPAYTSQTCYLCKHVDTKSRESQAVFRCTACGHTDHADTNAAKNILNAAGYAVSACGDLVAGRSVKQEPALPRGLAHQPAFELVGIPEPLRRGGNQELQPGGPGPSEGAKRERAFVLHNLMPAAALLPAPPECPAQPSASCR